VGRQHLGKEGTFKVSIGTMDVRALGRTHALVVAPTTITATTAQGPVEARGAVTLVLERAAGSWKIVNEHYSTRPQQQ
jgi:ketosteroid isomerase-like protein